MIIDCHTHLNNYEDENVDALSTSLDKLKTAMRRNRIDQALVLTSYKVGPGRPSTRAVVDATQSVHGSGGEQHRRDVLGLAASAVADHRHIADARCVVDLHMGLSS